jgi:hypothetical protein
MPSDRTPNEARSRRRRSGARDLLLVAALAWAAYGFLQDVAIAHHRARQPRGHNIRRPFLWRPTDVQPRRLKRCLRRLVRDVPEDTRLVLYAPSDEDFRYRWAAYFLPAYDVVPPLVPPSGPRLAVGLREVPPDGTRLRGNRACGLYRLP